MKFILAVIFVFELQFIAFCVKYEMIFQGIEFCNNPDPPYEKQKKVDVHIVAVNNSDNFYYNANFSVFENLAGYSWRFKNGYEKVGRIIYENDFKGLSCRSFLPKVIYGISSLKFNSKTCEIFPGNYSFHKLEVTKLDRGANLLPNRHIGVNVFFLSYYKPSGTCFCIESQSFICTWLRRNVERSTLCEVQKIVVSGLGVMFI
uniref:SFRICE_039585 n=1 Tax=Spodoptera frugiperda TaxID=7108 RepID=A0A2H1W421_SPOFR